MATVLSAKELLSSYNVLDPEGKQKYVHYEFQSFAYKLAHDLNDLQNLKIYMRLAKNIERSLMERAYSYALDAQTDNRGKKFMWKLKELRQELKERVNATNFEYEFVYKESKEYREKLSGVLLTKKNRFNEIECFSENLPNKNKVLVVNCLNYNIVDKLIRAGYKISAFDSSRSIKKQLLEKFDFVGKKLLPKISCADFLKNRMKENSFDYIILNESWCTIPIESEVKYLKNVIKLLKPKGRIQLVSKDGNDKEEWKKYRYKDVDLKYFIKINNSSALLKKFEELGLKIANKIEYDSETLFILEID